MERPGFQAMLAEIEQGKASAVFVKDLSRLGRNYIEVGKLMEEFFPEHDIRFVSVSDNIDTDEGENELAPIKNLFNEWYSRDISKKRRISNKIKGNAGEPMGQPPYGYQKDPDDPKRWIIDEEAAAVVRRIYRMSLDGYGVEQIADALSKDGILTPRFYWQQKGIHRPGKAPKYDPCHWNGSTITRILTLQEYCGDVLNFKTYSKSYTVQYNYHISVERMNYSVPYEYIKQQVDVRLTRTTVEIFFAGTRIASHLRLHGRPNQYSTVEGHMPPDHQAYLQWNGERFIRWAEQIGQHTAAVVRLFLSAHKVEQQGYKSCMALLKLADRYSSQRLESACQKALSYTSSPSLKSVQSILKSGQDKLLTEDAPARPEEPKAHKFTRGAGYYKRGE